MIDNAGVNDGNDDLAAAGVGRIRVVDPDVPLVRIIREFDFPAAKVFRAHVDPDLFLQWSGPRYLDTKIDRLAIAAGWFLLDQVFLKAEYMMQNYNDYPAGNVRNGGKISGLTVQAVVGF